MTGFIETVMTVFRKEMWEHFRTKRLIVIGAIFAFVFIVISLYGGILAGGGSTDLSFKAGANSVLRLVLSFTGYFPGLMAIVISYTAIVGERSRKSLILLVSKPVKRPALFLGKFLSSYFAIVLVYVVVMTVGYFCVVGASGKVPSLEEVGRAYGAVGFVLFTMACWVAFAMFLSSALKNPITVAVAAIMVWFLVLPIVSEVGLIYWMVNTNNSPTDPNFALIQTPGGNATVDLSGLDSPVYIVYNSSGPLPGSTFQGFYSAANVPPGNYSWTATGTGIKRTGTVAVDGLHSFSITFDPWMSVKASADLNVTVEKGGTPVTPSKTDSSGPIRNYTWQGASGGATLTISQGGRVLFSGNFTLDRQSGGRGFGGASTATPPDYVKYDQLINPDTAMTGYTQVLVPGAASSISPSEGAAALTIFFATFMALGLLVFSKTEMV